MKTEVNGAKGEQEPDLFDLNPHRLDEEWLKQARYYHKYAVELADAREAHERAKSARDVVGAELALDVRSQPEKYGFDGPKGPTVDAVQQTVLTAKTYREADAAVIKARHALDVVQAFVDALDHRKKALENLVELRLADYFSDPRAPKGAERVTGERSFGRRK